MSLIHQNSCIYFTHYYKSGWDLFKSDDNLLSMKQPYALFILFFMISCSNNLDQKSSLGLSDGIQSEHRTPSIFLISEPTENDGKPLKKDRFDVTTEIVSALLDSVSSSQKVTYIGSAEKFKKLTEKFNSNDQLTHIDSPPYHWLQDMFEVYWDNNKQLKLGVPWGNENLLNQASNIALKLGGTAFIVPSQQPPIITIDGDLPGPGFNLMGIHGTVGGNIERWTNSVGFIGLSDFPSEKDALKFSQIVFPQGLTRAVLPTQWLYLGHLDEVIKPITFENLDNPIKCKIQVLVADPLIGLKILSKNKETPILDGKERDLSSFANYQELCKAAKKKRCKNMSWNSLFKNKEFKESFEKIQKSASNELYNIRSLVEKTFKDKASCRIDWLPLPQLYLAKFNKDKTRLARRSAGALYPNLTNGIVVHSSYITVDPGIKIFSDYTQQQLISAHLKTKFVKGNGYFQGSFMSGGHIHCMSQVVRE